MRGQWVRGRASAGPQTSATMLSPMTMGLAEEECNLAREPQPRSRTVTIASIEGIESAREIDISEIHTAISLPNDADCFVYIASRGQVCLCLLSPAFSGEVVGPEPSPPIMHHVCRHDIMAQGSSEVHSL